MTDLLFREDAYLRECRASVVGNAGGAILLDRTVFYYTSGGQPGDTGVLTDKLCEWRIDGTVVDETGRVLHLTEGHVPVGTEITARIDWPRRYRLMKMHTVLHLVMAVVPCQINGAQIGAEKSRIDFDTGGYKLDKSAIQAALESLISENHPITPEWVNSDRLDDDPTLVRTMATEPPRGDGKVRLVRIGADIDLQPCGGTHVRSTGEVGGIFVGKIDNKGAHNKRVTIHLRG